MTRSSVLRRSWRLLAAGALTLLALASVALAIPPGGPSERREGASVTITNDSSLVAPNGTVTYTGSGFPANTVVSVKIDDGLILPTTPVTGTDVFAQVTSDGSGAIAGSVDLTTVRSADQAAVADGSHRLRFLTSSPARSVHADFAVRTPSGPASNAQGGAVAIGPPADQLLDFPFAGDPDLPYGDIPRLVEGSAIPFRFAGFDAGQQVSFRLDDAPTLVGSTLADAAGTGYGYLRPAAAPTVGAHWLRFLGSNTVPAGATARSIRGAFAIVANDGRDVQMSASATQGGAISFTTTGLKRSPADYVPATPVGQTLEARLAGGTPVRVTADATGVATGSIPVPSTLAPGTYQVVFSVGFAVQNDFPQAVFVRDVTITAPIPAVTPTTTSATTPVTTKTTTVATRKPVIRSTSLRATGGKVKLVIRAGTKKIRTVVALRTRSKLRVSARSKAKIVTIARRTYTINPGTGSRAITLTLTRDGRALMRRLKSVGVRVTIVPQSGSVVRKSLTLRR